MSPDRALEVEGAAPTLRTADRRVLGVVLGGGANRRYGGRPKALEPVAGARIIDRIVGPLRRTVDGLGLVTNDRATFETLDLPIRTDLEPGLGPLGGLQTALAWADDESYCGALVVACDMPFVSVELFRELVNRAAPDIAVVPESERGLEPLCAFYGRACRPVIDDAIGRGDRALITLLDRIPVRPLPLKAVRTLGTPEVLFWNVNTPADRNRADELARTFGREAP